MENFNNGEQAELVVPTPKTVESLKWRNKIILVSVLSAVLVAVLAYLLYVGLPEKNNTHQLAGSQKKASIKDCDNAAVQSECYFKIAAENQDLSICENLLDPYQQGFCAYAVIGSVINVEGCKIFKSKEIGGRDYTDQCYSGVAFKNMDMSMCNLISEKAEKDFCDLGVAVSKKDANLCKGLAYAGDCNFQVAEANQNLEFCKTLPDSDQPTCRLRMGAAKNNPEDCKTFTVDSLEQDACLSLIAKSTSNADLCKGISCIRDVALKHKDISLCPKTGNEEQRCYTEILPLLNDETLCSKYLTYQNDLDECYKNIAEKKASVAICKRISNGGSQIQCVTDVALWKKDKAVCQNLDTPQYKEGCEKGYDDALSYLTAPAK